MDMRKYRRQATWLCFKSYLSEEQLLQAIRILESDFQLEGTINLIAYVAKLCMEFGINFETQKIVYSQFYALMSETDKLEQVNDPLTLLIEQEQVTTIDAISENSAIPVDNPVEDSTAAADQQEQEVVAPNLPAHNVVFTHFMSSMLVYMTNKADVFTVLTEMVADKKMQSQDLAIYIQQWAVNSSNFTWSESLNQETLTRLVHFVYMGLCELLGPVAADDCFHKSLAVCEQNPEARIFSPSQFL